MKPKIIVALLFITLTSCAPVAEPTPTETPVPTVTFTPVPTSTVTPITATMLPLQPTSTPNPTQEKQHEEIKSVIQAYFEIHYRALSISPPEDFQQNGFGDLVSDEPEANDFLVTEMGKLAVERKHFELNKLRYVEYEYSLDYKDIVIDASTQIAMVSLVEGFEVIRESSVEANPEYPHVSIMGGCNHEIVLHNEQGEWKIVSDIYYDYLWRALRSPGESIDDVLRSIDIKMHQLEAKASPTP